MPETVGFNHEGGAVFGEMRGLEESVLTKMNGVGESNMDIHYFETQINNTR